MKTLFRYLTFCVVSLFGINASAHAQQTLSVTGGKFHIALDPGWLTTLQSLGITATITHGKDKVDVSGLPVVGGDIDAKTGAGDIRTSGKITFLAGSNKLEIMGLTLDTSDPAYPVITGMVTFNDVFQGRRHVFTVVSGDPYKLPCKAGPSQSTIGYFKRQDFLSFLQVPFPALAPDQLVGSFTVDFTTEKQ